IRVPVKSVADGIQLSVTALGRTANDPVPTAPVYFIDKTILFPHAVSKVTQVSETGLAATLLPFPLTSTYASINRVTGKLVIEAAGRTTLGSDIWEFDRSGVQSRKLLSDDAINSNPSWSPDGTKIVFQSKRGSEPTEVRVYDTATNKTTRLDQGLTPTWDESGKAIIYSKGGGKTWNLWSKDLTKGTSPRQLTFGAQRDQYPVAGKIGKAGVIVFASNRETDVYDIWRIDPSGKNPVRLTSVGKESGQRMVGPALSPNGDLIAFWEINYNANQDHSVWLVNSDGTNPRRFIRKAANPQWAANADGKQTLYFDSRVTGRAQIWFVEGVSGP
ncbi:MAG TPA: hypothetical protein VF678_04655, partial [bacterium]